MNSSRLLIILILSAGAFSAFSQTLPEQFTIEGRLYSSGVALSGSVDIKFEVIDSANAACVLYREVHSNIDLGSVPATQGIFALKLGSGTSTFHPQRLSLVFSNGVQQTGDNNADDAADVPCMLTPAAGSQRLVKMYVSQDSGTTWTYLGPDTAVTTTPTAMVAETLQGRGLSDFIMADPTLTYMNQNDVKYIFNNTNYPRIKALADGTSSSYMSANPTASVDFNNQRIINVATPTGGADATNKSYVDANIGGKSADLSGVGPAAGNGHTLIWDMATQKWTTGVPNASDPLKLPLAGGTMTGAITMGGFDILGTGNITMSPLKTLNLGTFTTAQETTLVGTLTATHKGVTWYNSTSNETKVFDGTSAITQAYLSAGKLNAAWMPSSVVTSSTAAGGDLTGTYPSPTIGNDKITSAKLDSGNIAINQLVISDQTTGGNLKFATCATNEILRYEGANGWICRDPNLIVTAPVTMVNGKLGNVILNAADLGLGSAALENVGTAAGNVVQLDGTSRIPSTLLPSNVVLDGGNTTAGPMFVGTTNSNVLKLGAGGSTAVQIQPSGKVDITTDSSDPLMITGSNTGMYSFRIQNTLNTGTTWFAASNNANHSLFIGATGDNFSSPGIYEINSGVIYADQNLNSLNIGTESGQPIKFFNGATEKMGLYAGKLGIGSTSPTRLLDVAGPIHIAPASLSGGSAGDIAIDSGASNSLKWHNGSSWLTIGTGTGDFLSTGSVPMTGSLQMGGNTIYGSSFNSGNLTLESTTNATKGFVNLAVSGGSVGIGTNAPARLLHVNGPARFTPAALPSSPAAGEFVFDSGGSNKLKYHDGSAWKTVTTDAGAAYALSGANSDITTMSALTSITPSSTLTLSPTSSLLLGHPSTGSTTVRSGTSGTNVQSSGTTLITSSKNAISAVQITSTGGTSSSILMQSSSSAQAGIDLQSAGGIKLTPSAFPVAVFGHLTTSSGTKVGIGTSTPSNVPAVTLEVYGTDAMLIPSGATANRPATPVNGMLRYNSALDVFEGFAANAWSTIGGGGSGGDFKKDGTVAMTGDFNAGFNNILNATTVGIGTSATSNPLHVFGRTGPLGISNWSSSIFIDDPLYPGIAFGGTGSGVGALIRESAGTLSFINGPRGLGSWGGNERLTILPGGNIGIGTNAPNFPLQVGYSPSGANDAAFFAGAVRAQNSANSVVTPFIGSNTYNFVGAGSAIAFQSGSNPSNQATVGGVIESLSPAHGQLQFSTLTNNTLTQKMVVTSAGNLGVGLTNPTAKIQASGSIVSKSFTSSGLVADFANGNTVILNTTGGSAITLNNMADGGNYTLIIKEPTSYTYSFSNCGTTHWRPANAATVSSNITIYSIIAVGPAAPFECYINWSSGYN